MRIFFTHRRKVLGELRMITGIIRANAVTAVQDEIAIIEGATKELKPPPGSLPKNDRARAQDHRP